MTGWGTDEEVQTRMHDTRHRVSHRALRAVLAAACTPALFVACATIREIQETPVEWYYGTVRGQVLDDETSSPISAARVYLVLDREVSARDSRATWSYEEGAFVFASVQPGTYHVKAEADGYAAQASGPLVVQQGQLFRVTMRMERTGR